MVAQPTGPVENLVVMMASLNVLDAPDGTTKLLQFMLPTGRAYTFPLDPTAVETLIAQLKGSPVQVARTMPPSML